MTGEVGKKVHEFKSRYPGTIVWRLRAHCKLIEKYLNPGEIVIYAFPGQRSPEWYNIFMTCVIVLTNKRILIATKRVLFGYFLSSITPDMFNDFTVHSRILFGAIEIDTVKERIYISNISKRALDEIETEISEYLLREKKKYAQKEQKSVEI